TVSENKGIQKDCSPDAIGDFLCHPLDDRSSKAMAHKDDVTQLVLLNVTNDRRNTISMCSAGAPACRTMAGKRRSICTMPLPGKAANDLIPCPSAVPGSVNQYKSHVHGVFFPPKIL